MRINLSGGGYTLQDLPFGVPEDWPLDFCSPMAAPRALPISTFGTMLGFTDYLQWFPPICIYGPHQFGNEDQGWLAHFVFSALLGRPITIFGDGFQSEILYTLQIWFEPSTRLFRG